MTCVTGFLVILLMGSVLGYRPLTASAVSGTHSITSGSHYCQHALIIYVQLYF